MAIEENSLIDDIPRMGAKVQAHSLHRSALSYDSARQTRAVVPLHHPLSYRHLVNHLIDQMDGGLSLASYTIGGTNAVPLTGVVKQLLMGAFFAVQLTLKTTAIVPPGLHHFLY